MKARNARLFLIATLVALLPFVSAQPQAATSTPNLTGTAVAADTGLPLADATVFAEAIRAGNPGQMGLSPS